jgi:hypothetical protein
MKIKPYIRQGHNIVKLKKPQFLLFAILLLVACKFFTSEPPGVGEKSERGYAICEPMIKALEQYRVDTGEYPEALTQLIPKYLSVVSAEVNNEPISYTKTDEGFSLSFHYVGPGMNTCTYTPKDKWHCSGAF